MCFKLTMLNQHMSPCSLHEHAYKFISAFWRLSLCDTGYLLVVNSLFLVPKQND